MNRTLKALLLLSGVVVLIIYELRGNTLFIQHNPLLGFEGEWVFEKAEYLERSSPASDYQVKYEISNAEGLEGLPGCLQQAAKSISIRDVAQVECPYTSYCGRAFLAALNDPKGDKYLLTIGCDFEEMGRESPIPGLFFNIVGLEYRLEKISEDTIAITKEATCVDNSVETHSAVKCFLKK